MKIDLHGCYESFGRRSAWLRVDQRFANLEIQIKLLLDMQFYEHRGIGSESEFM